MHLNESFFNLRKPVMISAFEGWNDAGESASGALTHLLASWTHHKLATLDPEEFYDFQVNRPSIKIDEQVVREIVWPNTIIFEVSTPHLPHDFLIVRGIEPSMRWQTFANLILDLADDYEVSLSVALGGLLADSPHSRPITVSASGSHPDVASRLGVEISRYEGPTGIVGIIQDAACKRGIDAVSLWAAVPHYVSSPPCPKASLALINALEDFLEISIPLGDLPERSEAWERQVDEMANEDAEVGDYVKQLERSKDEADIPAATGESIAKEVERFLRRNPGL
ncbi:MAG: PAC2 family protein [Candidatus Nanopelagicaceae bacterium]